MLFCICTTASIDCSSWSWSQKCSSGKARKRCYFKRNF